MQRGLLHGERGGRGERWAGRRKGISAVGWSQGERGAPAAQQAAAAAATMLGQCKAGRRGMRPAESRPKGLTLKPYRPDCASSSLQLHGRVGAELQRRTAGGSGALDRPPQGPP